MTHPGSLPSQCQDFKPSVVHTLQSARQRPSSAEIPPSDSWLDRHFSVPKGANLWFCKSFVFEKCWLFWWWRRGTCQGLYSPHSSCEEAPNGASWGPFRMWNTKILCFNTLRGAAGYLSCTLQVLHELRDVLLEGRSGRISCLNFAVVQRLLLVV